MSSHESFVWLNGSLLQNREARVSALDHGFTVGDGAFETLRAWDGSLFAFTRHWNRLVRSCAILGIHAPPRNLVLQAMHETLNASRLRDARVRFTVTSGEGPAGSDRGRSSSTMVCTAVPAPVYGETEHVAVSPWVRNERGALTGAKSVSYGENVVALAHAKLHGAGEAVFANTRGDLCEGTGTNVFLVHRGELHTPPLSSGCLAGVTRELVIELCRTAGIPLSESPLPVSALAEADEAFLTSSTRGIHCIAQVDDKTISKTVGPLTRRVAELFRNLVRENTDP